LATWTSNGLKRINGEILGNKGIEGLSTIPNLEKKCFIDPKEKARGICSTTTS
jgi:hypothetical protein